MSNIPKSVTLMRLERDKLEQRSKQVWDIAFASTFRAVARFGTDEWYLEVVRAETAADGARRAWEHTIRIRLAEEAAEE